MNTSDITIIIGDIPNDFIFGLANRQDLVDILRTYDLGFLEAEAHDASMKNEVYLSELLHTVVFNTLVNKGIENIEQGDVTVESCVGLVNEDSYLKVLLSNVKPCCGFSTRLDFFRLDFWRGVFLNDAMLPKTCTLDFYRPNRLN